MQVEGFLARYPPFDALGPEELRRVAGSVQIGFFPAGTTILVQSGEPATSLYVIRTGAVEVLDEGRVVDLLLEGEIFGHPSLLSGLGPALSVRAHEDTLCYLVDRREAERLFGTPTGLAYLTAHLGRRTPRTAEASQAGRSGTALSPVGGLIRRPPVTCAAATPIRDAAELMARERVSSVLVLGGPAPGILTDRDLRSRVLAAGRSPSTPVGEVMSSPLVTVPAEDTVEEVLLAMLEHGIHHLPVTDGSGVVVGVVSDTDLLGLERTDAFAVRSAIERAPDRRALLTEARKLPVLVRGLVSADVDPVHVGRVVAITIDALTERLLELAIAELGDPPGPWAWLALGSQARGEQALATDQDHGLAFEPGELGPEETDRYFAALAARVTDGLEAAGIPRCRGGVMASNPSWRRTASGWVAELRRWMGGAGPEGRVFTSIALDYRRVGGPLDVERHLDAEIRRAPAVPGFVRRVARTAIDLRPPTGFLRDHVVEAFGTRAQTLDVKRGGIIPITNLGRAYAVAAGIAANGTLPRLRAAADAGLLQADLAVGLEEAFRLLWKVRLDHQASRAAADEPAGDLVDLSTLGPVARRSLKEAFRTIIRAQRALANELGLRPW
ncbi:MAG TPA: DUF294 nucleotidyltransferase-like domain-containing protein [Actinomycetota bacterium]|nr:DUF294 nucleotidyltransferase-like domain-containing protein [Actinomycetota bacterium]